jgi:plasmid replication initiation protein
VQSIFYKHSITELEASKILKTAKNDVDIIKQKYNIICQTNNIKNIVGATIQAIKEDWQGQKQNSNSTFNNFKQRDYDFKDLEKKLLGWE